MKLGISKLLGIEFKHDGFVEALEEGVVHDEFAPNPGHWRVSELVNLWGKKIVNKDKLLLKALIDGTTEKDFTSDTYKIFHLGTAIHDIVKDYLQKSPHFNVIKEEKSIKHKTLPITGTMDMIVEWEKYPNQEFIVEIKSCGTDYYNRPGFGSKYKPFNKHKLQAGLYSTIYGAPAIILYYDKDKSDMCSHLLREKDYKKDVDELLASCERVYKQYKEINKE